MRRGGRILMLPTALVYLAEAAWQRGEEAEADALAKEAYSVARTNGTSGGCFSRSPTSPAFSTCARSRNEA